jgi:phosphoglycolate phosphatase
MSHEKPTIVIFDMDGTAVRHINPHLLHVLEKIDDAFYTLSRFFSWLFRRGARGPIIAADDAFLNRRKPRLLVHRAMHKFRRKDVEQIVEPCPGIYTVLQFLRAHNIPMALVSNGLGKGYGHDILEKFDLGGFFTATVFREDIKKSKPAPDALLLALNRMGVTPGPGDVIWFVGDRHKDVLAALAAAAHTKARIVPIAYALHAAIAILEKGLNADNILMSYYDMHDRLRALLGEAPAGKPALRAEKDNDKKKPALVSSAQP